MANGLFSNCSNESIQHKSFIILQIDVGRECRFYLIAEFRKMLMIVSQIDFLKISFSNKLLLHGVAKMQW